MSARRLTFLVMGFAAIVALAATAPKIAISAQVLSQVGPLNANEGIYVDRNGFGIVKGATKADPTDHLIKLGAIEVKEGAIIFRAGDKLYLIDTDPKAKSMYSGWADDAFNDAKP